MIKTQNDVIPKTTIELKIFLIHKLIQYLIVVLSNESLLFIDDTDTVEVINTFV